MAWSFVALLNLWNWGYLNQLFRLFDVWRAYSGTSGICRYDSATFQFVSMKSQDSKADHRLLFCAYVDETHDAAMRLPVYDREFPKVLVEGNQDSRIIVSS